MRTVLLRLAGVLWDRLTASPELEALTPLAELRCQRCNAAWQTIVEMIDLDPCWSAHRAARQRLDDEAQRPTA